MSDFMDIAELDILLSAARAELARLDARLFPSQNTIPKGGCRQTIHAMIDF